MNKNIKVVYCTLYLPHYRSDLFDYISKNQNIDLTVFADQTTEGGFRLKHRDDVSFNLNEIKLHKIKIPILNKFIYWIPYSIKVLFKSYDVYIMPNRMTIISGWICLLLGKFLNKKIWLWGHGKGSEKYKFGKILRKFFMKLSYGCLFYDFRTTETFGKKFPNKYMIAVPNTINNLKIEKEFENKFGEKIDDYIKTKKKEKNIILFIGRLIKEKKPDILIYAINELKNKLDNVFCYFIGEGEMRKNMEELIEKYDLKDNIKIVGELYEDDKISEYFSKAKLTVIPANAGLSINHSMCYGVPVVIGDNFKSHGPESHMINDGQNGFIFKDEDYKELAEIIFKYLSDEELAIKMSLASRNTIKEIYNIENMANSLIKSFYL